MDPAPKGPKTEHFKNSLRHWKFKRVDNFKRATHQTPIVLKVEVEPFQARLKFSSKADNFKRDLSFSRLGPLGVGLGTTQVCPRDKRQTQVFSLFYTVEAQFVPGDEPSLSLGQTCGRRAAEKVKSLCAFFRSLAGQRGEKATQNGDHNLVLFYSPWQGHWGSIPLVAVTLSSADRKRGQRKGATSKNVKIVKKCQKYLRTFSTIFAQGKKRQKASKSVKIIF